jgi:hypothetical protein
MYQLLCSLLANPKDFSKYNLVEVALNKQNKEDISDTNITKQKSWVYEINVQSGVKRVQTKLHNLPVLTHCGFYE